MQVARRGMLYLYTPTISIEALEFIKTHMCCGKINHSQTAQCLLEINHTDKCGWEYKDCIIEEF